MISWVRLMKSKKDATLFREIFDYDMPDKMLQTLHGLQRVDSYNLKAILIEDTIISFDNMVKKISEGAEKNEKKIVKIVSKILDFGLNQRNKKGQELKILTTIQMLSRLPISLAQLNAENNSKKNKNEIRQLLYSLYRSKNLQKNICKCSIDII